MAFDLDTWKDKFKERMRDWKPRMQHAGISSVYAFVSAAALWPVVEAARAGEWAALAALGSLLAGLGTNLLANQIQSWKDEADAAQKLTESIPEDPALRAELDAVLEKMQALSIAEQSLTAADRTWFAETVRAELASLGSSVHYTFIGGDSIDAPESKGFINRPSGPVRQVFGTSIEAESVTLAGNVYLGPRPEDPAQVRRRYLERLRRHCQVLPLAALGGEDILEEDITLDRVYIDLDTTTKVPLTKAEKKQRKEQSAFLEREEGTRPLTVLEAAIAAPRLALLGDPGAGKSTFVRNLLAWLAAANLGEAKPPYGISKDLLPLLVVLRDLAPRLATLDLQSLSAKDQRQARVAAVWEQIVEDLKRLEADAFAASLHEALLSGQCLLAMDGLDEVPHDLRLGVRQAVEALLVEFRLERVIITCRVRSYTGEAIFPDFQAHTLAPFDEDKIRQFANAWYKAQKDMGRVDAEQARSKAEDMSQAALTDDLRELSANPMMLTAMAIIHQKEIGLPKERVRLYKLIVDVLLVRWQKQKVGERGLTPSPDLTNFLRNDLRLRDVVERLAYEAHRGWQGKGKAADLSRGTALTLLEASEYLGEARLAAEFLDYVDQRAGLLIGHGGEPGHPATYGFPHRTFQEYLAGCYLAGQRDVGREFFARAGEGDYWDLAAQLGAEELYYNRRSPNTLLDLAYRLSVEPLIDRDQRALLWSGNMAALVGRELVERDIGSPQGGQIYLDLLLPRLVKLLESDLMAPERADAGRALARLGDQRLEVTTLEAMQFCFVPAGHFQMGSDKERDPGAFDDENPQHDVNLKDYWISRFPVTNAQFEMFCAAGGYSEPRFWAEARQAKAWEDGFVIRRVYSSEESKFIQGREDRPHDFGEPFTLPNHPVVGLTWYEALAFTRWLEGHWREDGLLPAGWAVGLPSEAEWEKAARGGVEIPIHWQVNSAREGFISPAGFQLHTNPSPARIYPWEGDFDANNANIDVTGIGSPSAVGCFPGGASPYGVLDLSGNVWEWTRSLWGKNWEKPDFKYPYEPGKDRENLEAPSNMLRVLRGGSFISSRRNARCAYRSGLDPDHGSGGGGFRVVVSPLGGA